MKHASNISIFSVTSTILQYYAQFLHPEDECRRCRIVDPTANYSVVVSPVFQMVMSRRKLVTVFRADENAFVSPNRKQDLAGMVFKLTSFSRGTGKPSLSWLYFKRSVLAI